MENEVFAQNTQNTMMNKDLPLMQLPVGTQIKFYFNDAMDTLLKWFQNGEQVNHFGDGETDSALSQLNRDEPSCSVNLDDNGVFPTMISALSTIRRFQYSSPIFEETSWLLIYSMDDQTTVEYPIWSFYDDLDTFRQVYRRDLKYDDVLIKASASNHSNIYCTSGRAFAEKEPTIDILFQSFGCYVRVENTEDRPECHELWNSK